MKKYKEYTTAEDKGELFNITEYRVTTKETSLPSSDWIPQIPKKSDIDSLFLVDIKKYNKDKTSSLITRYKDKLKITPDDLKTHLALANVYKENGLLNEATKEYEQVLLLDNKNMAVLYALADFALYNKKLEEAKNYFNKILEIYPTEPRATFETGEILYSQEKYEDAIEYYEKYHKLNTNDAKLNGTAQLKIGLSFASLKKLQRAVKELEKFISNFPDHEMVEDTKKTLEILKNNL